MTKVLITGGAGFIGSALVRHAVLERGWSVLNIDKLTYAGNPDNLRAVEGRDNHTFLKADICDKNAMRKAFADFKPDFVIHLAAESHVDRSIDSAEDFIQTNIIGTYRLLECALDHYRALPADAQKTFRFHHVSTDEVYGALGEEGAFSETTPYAPSSPYSASKASSDHLVHAWFKTYGLPVTISNCSNNYGPCQHPEKLIPRMILNALAGERLPVYGSGQNVRDWLYVDDHVRAIIKVIEQGRLGETYNVGGKAERRNIEIVRLICQTLDEIAPAGQPHDRLITFVADRPGHDFRYAIDSTKIETELGWQPQESFDSGLRKTIEWYVQGAAGNKDFAKKAAKG